MSSSPTNDDDFVTKTTKHRKKAQAQAAATAGSTNTSSSTSSGNSDAKKPPVASNGSAAASNISLRPRTMFAMKGRGRTESEGSQYRPQWSKDGEGFVSGAGGSASFKDAAAGDAEHRGERRKSKVLRYTKEELLALHFTTTEMPSFPPETMVASEHCLPPVSTLPFDYEEIYKQWSLNRNRGRGRGRGNAAQGGTQNTRGHQERRGDGKWEDNDNSKQRGEEHRHTEKGETWERGVRVTEESQGDDVWDDVLEPGADSNEMDLSSMAEAAEKFRREMDAMREELEGPKPNPDDMKDDLDAFDKKLEDAAAAGQFEDSDNEEVQWDEPLEKSDASDPLEGQHQTTNLLGRQSSGSHLFDALEPTGDQFVLEEKSSFSLSSLQANEELPGLSSLRLEVEDEWFYLDPQGLQQGPFKTAEMREWFEAGYFKPHLPIRFGREGAFAALANQFVNGQMPFSGPPPRMSPDIGAMHIDPRQSEHQRLIELQQQQQRQQQQQQQQMLQLQQQQQQEQQRMLQLNQEEKIRIEMQRLEMARQQQQTQLYHQQQMLQHQQEQQRQQHQQQMLLQQQSSWQRSQREGIMSALGMFGGNQENNIGAGDNFRSDGMQLQFQSDFRTQHQLNLQNQQSLDQNAIFLNDEGQRRDQAFWPSTSPDAGRLSGVDTAPSSLGSLQQARPESPTAPETAQPPATNSPVTDAWGTRPMSPQLPSQTLHEIQDEEKRLAADKVRSSLGGDRESGHSQSFSGSGASREQFKEGPSAKSPVKDKNDLSNQKKVASPTKKNGKQGVKNEANAWTTSAATPSSSKSLKDIQREEQREMRSQMDDDNSGTTNLAQMGAQLKMMLGVDSLAAAPDTQPAPTPEATPSAPRAPAPAAAPVTSPWGAPATVSKSTTASKKQSMRDILAEEERMAQERAKANANAPTSSHWMNVVAGNTAPTPALPKPSRSVLGPVPASVLKSRQQIRAANGAPKPSPPKPESDASFWNFGAAQSAGADFAAASSSSNAGSGNAFGSSASSEFMAWATKQLQTIDSNANVTLLEYCASVEDPGEIREYLAAYLGSTPRVSAFATEFIQRKKTQHSGKKSPVHQDAQQRASETGSSNKRGKRRTKGQKIDPSLLNYSVGS
ncbi:hypothetical protein PHYBOEH_002391 [Phytophthora boehmeriae]|uniref:GYF domain-containing protein n=1 Tax=Phytophthora boehmeriae TaxID=109152 RepID=A0A8T1X561_9STRA|nr:hypothetical protein PHYBOEH_002391 [Phytophthora boehmeriae]